ncbi:MAG: hypothetical protein U0892_02640 [Pirellulales bacterium]
MNQSTKMQLRRGRVQLRLITVLLLTASIAAWFSAWLNTREAQKLEARIAALQPMANELFIRDLNRLAVIQKAPMHQDELVWDVNIPDRSSVIHLSTKNVPRFDSANMFDALPADASFTLPQGLHRIEMKLPKRAEELRIELLVDGNKAFEAMMSDESRSRGSSQGGGNLEEQIDVDPSEPVCLYRRAYFSKDQHSYTSTTPALSSLMLWIAPAEWIEEHPAKSDKTVQPSDTPGETVGP